MSIEIVKSLLVFFGGVAMFVYGMQIMADGLQQAAGEKTRHLLEILTSNRLLAVLVGAAVTAIIQSSGATTVMVVGFVNAQLMSLAQAVGVIMGANIGTTMTAWIVSVSEWGAFLQPEMLAPVLLLIGVCINMFAKNGRVKNGSSILIGFGLLFMGLSTMTNAVSPYADAPIFTTVFSTIGGNPILGLLTGAIVTAIMQSSSASMGILQTLALTGIVNWGSAVFIALGQNIGTCVVALISSIGTDTNAKRAALIHLEFNVIGSIIVGTAAFVFFAFNPDLMQMHVTSTSLAMFHTGFNVLTTIMLFPFANQLVQLSKFFIRGHQPKEENKIRLDSRLLQNSSIALQAINRELVFMGRLALKNIGYSRDCVVDNENFEELDRNEERVDLFYNEISSFAQKVNSTTMTTQEKLEFRNAILILRDLEHISDRCMEIAAIKQKNIEKLHLSETAIQNINTLSSQCEDLLKMALDLSASPDPAVVEKFQNLLEEARRNAPAMREEKFLNISSLHDHMLSSMVYLEIMDRYERIANHARRVYEYVSEDQGSPENPAMLDDAYSLTPAA